MTRRGRWIVVLLSYWLTSAGLAQVEPPANPPVKPTSRPAKVANRPKKPASQPATRTKRAQSPASQPASAASQPASSTSQSASQATQPARTERRYLPIGSVAPRFEAWTLDGVAVHMPEDYRGQLVLIQMWASWCPSCARDYPYWVQAQDTYGGRGLTLLGVSLDYKKKISAEDVQATIAERGGEWDVVYEGARDLERQYLTPVLPTLYLIDGDTGKIVDAGDDLRRGRLMKTLAKHLSEIFPQDYPATQPATDTQPTSSPTSETPRPPTSRPTSVPAEQPKRP